MADKNLERLRATIQELPTDGTVIERCHEECPDYLSTESLPVASEDKPLLVEFDEQLYKYKNKTYHHQLLSRMLTFCRYRSPPTPNGDNGSAHGISLSILLTNPNAAERFEDWITSLHTDDGDKIAPKTETHYRNAVRQYGDLMGEDGRPAHIENIKSISSRDSDEEYDPTPKRSNILHWDESVVPILDNPNVHIRDKALIAVAWDSGARPSELYIMKASHLTDCDDYFLFEIEDSKTQDRTPHLNASMPYLRKWLLELDKITEDINVGTSPLSIPPKQPIWTKQESSVQLASSTFQSIGRKIGNRLGYRRPTNLKQFRKSRASIIAAKGGINENTLRTRFGWDQGSSAPSHYIRGFSDKANQQIADIDGAPIQVSEEHAEPSPINCSSCDRWSPRHLNACFWCGTKISGDEPTADSELERLSNKAEINEAAKSSLKKRFDDLEVSGRSMELALDVVEAMESNPELTRESIAYVLLTEYEGLEFEHVMELLGDGEDDLRSIFKET